MNLFFNLQMKSDSFIITLFKILICDGEKNKNDEVSYHTEDSENNDDDQKCELQNNPEASYNNLEPPKHISLKCNEELITLLNKEQPKESISSESSNFNSCIVMDYKPEPVKRANTYPSNFTDELITNYDDWVIA